MQQTVGFIGTGRMGEPFARHLIDAGHRVHIFDTSSEAVARLAEAGAIAEDSARAVAVAAPILFVCLPTPQILSAVLTDSIFAAPGLEIVIDMSTSGPTTAKALAALAAPHGVEWVDSPVSGGVAGARKGTLAVMVSARDATYERVSPLLSLFGTLFHVGEAPGLAQIAKLGNNLLAASAMVVTSEVLAMGVKAGLDADVMLDIINAGTGRNSASVDKFPHQVVNGQFAHGFATGLSYKDVRLCVDEAELLGIPMVAGSAVRQMLAVTNSRYGPQSDFTCIAKVLEEWGGVEIRSRAEQLNDRSAA